MKRDQRKPQFELARSPQESSEAPQVFAVDGGIPQSLGRRKFLRLGAGVPAAAALAAFWSERAAAASTVIAAHKGAVYFLGMLPDGSALLSAADDGLKEWTLPDGALDGLFAAVTSLSKRRSLSPSGKVLASQDAGVVSLTAFPSGGLLGSLMTGISGPLTAALSPDDRWLAVADGSHIFLAPFSDVYAPVKIRRTIDARSGGITHLAIRGAQLISGSQDGRICTWKFPEGTPHNQFETGSPITSMLIVEEPFAVATGHVDGSILLTSLLDGKALFKAKVTPPIVGLEKGPNGLLAAGVGDGSIDVWSLARGEHLGTRQVEFSSSGSASSHGTRRGSLTALASAAKATLLAAGSNSGQIVLLDWPSMQLRTHLFDGKASPPDAKRVSFTIADKSTGRTITYTLPCGSEIPPGATCVCNCVAGTEITPVYKPNYTPSVPSPPIYSPPVTVPGETITRPCTPEPVPPGYVCTCNCVPGR